MTPATVLDVTRRVAWWLLPEYNRILQRIRSAPVVYVDETGVRVDGRRYWIWVFATEADVLIVVRKSRGKKVLEEVLGEGFDGVIVCDGWRSYPGFTDRIQRCWAHLLREARRLAEATLRKADELGIRMVFLPPYSPDLNPIEQVWRCLKRELSAAFFATRDEFLGLIEEVYGRLSGRVSFAMGWLERYLPEQFNQFRPIL